MTLVNRIFNALKDGPATALEVSAELDIDYRVASAYLSKLHLKSKELDRMLFNYSERGHKVYLYSLHGGLINKPEPPEKIDPSQYAMELMKERAISPKMLSDDLGLKGYYAGKVLFRLYKKKLLNREIFISPTRGQFSHMYSLKEKAQ